MAQLQVNQTYSPAHYVHVGAQLRELRVHYGLDILQVAQRLHIRSHYLEAIEEGDLSGLPGKVYTQGYIASYAEFLGLDPKEVLEHYEALGNSPQPAQFKVTEPTKQSGIPAWRWVAAGLVVAAVLYLLLQQLMTPSSEPIDSRIEPVPDRILERAELALIVNERNRECLRPGGSDSVLPCYYAGDNAIRGAFLMQPVRSIMELK